MCPLMYFQVFTPRKNFSASRKRTRKRFFASVHPDVVHQLVLRFESSAGSGTTSPSTRVICPFWTSDMFYGQMGNDIVHRPESFPANGGTGSVRVEGGQGRRVDGFGVYPETAQELSAHSHGAGRCRGGQAVAYVVLACIPETKL